MILVVHLPVTWCKAYERILRYLPHVNVRLTSMIVLSTHGSMQLRTVQVHDTTHQLYMILDSCHHTVL